MKVSAQSSNTHSTSQVTLQNTKLLVDTQDSARDRLKKLTSKHERLHTEEMTVSKIEGDDFELVNIVSSEDSVSQLSSVSLRIDSKNSVQA